MPRLAVLQVEARKAPLEKAEGEYEQHQEDLHIHF